MKTSRQLAYNVYFHYITLKSRVYIKTMWFRKQSVYTQG